MVQKKVQEMSQRTLRSHLLAPQMVEAIRAAQAQDWAIVNSQNQLTKKLVKLSPSDLITSTKTHLCYCMSHLLINSLLSGPFLSAPLHPEAQTGSQVQAL